MGLHLTCIAKYYTFSAKIEDSVGKDEERVQSRGTDSVKIEDNVEKDEERVQSRGTDSLIMQT